MEDKICDFWAATLQDGYIGNLIELIERAGGARNLMGMSPEQIKSRLMVSDKMVKHILACRDGIDISKKYEEMVNMGIHYVNYNDEEYPRRLRTIPSRPYGLFVKGSLPQESSKSVAIIGSRECTEYGRLMAEYLGDRLAKRGIDIVSGMAWGIDGIAQMAALNANGKSYGVLGCGVDVVYPRKNYRLYEKLIENGNGVISEYAPGTQAKPNMFPPRNRIISGLCDVLIVVEARAKSGTLITVEMASQQNKTIMIVPGRITDPLSVGCLKLMKEGAVPITCIEDVLVELCGDDFCADKKGIYTDKYDFASNKNVNDDGMSGGYKGSELTLSEKEQKVYDLIGVEPESAEKIFMETNIALGEVLGLLTNLELKGLIRDVGGCEFVKSSISL